MMPTAAMTTMAQGAIEARATPIMRTLHIKAAALCATHRDADRARQGASPAAADKSKSTAGAPTSDRSPDKQATTPNSQVDTTANGETSDRTPKNHGANGAASGEQGTGSASNQTWDQTYQSDKAQEQQLKGGGTSR